MSAITPGNGIGNVGANLFATRVTNILQVANKFAPTIKYAMRSTGAIHESEFFFNYQSTESYELSNDCRAKKPVVHSQTVLVSR